jgi:mono/diheme cytochrome c family protein
MLNKSARRFIFCMTGMAALLGTELAHAADIAQGEALARRWCASCHVVDKSAVMRDVPPNFATIAQRPSLSESSLLGWLNAPHPSMPNFELSRGELSDLVAYIRSLAPRGD